MPETEPPTVSVVVPTYNRSNQLADCLSNLLTQDFHPDRFEIIVADDGSDDDTAAVVERDFRHPHPPHIRYLPLPHRGANAARNAALRVSRAELVCFVDDDVRAPVGWLSSLFAGAERNPEAACLGGPMRLRWQGKLIPHCGAETFGESELDLGETEREVELVHGGNMALRRWAVDRVGEFRETKLPGLDEVELIDRLRAVGLAVVYVPDAWVWHWRTPDQCRLSSVVGRRFARGVGQARAMDFVGQRYRFDWEYQTMRKELKHAATERCAWGLVKAAHAAGRLTGTAECVIRRHLGRPVR